MHFQIYSDIMLQTLIYKWMLFFISCRIHAALSYSQAVMVIILKM